MRARLLDFVWCPRCKSDLKLTADKRDPNDGDEILTGALSCEKCSSRFPILGGIPRLVDGIQSEGDLRKVYADSFGHQWTTYNWLRDEDKTEFFQITDFKKADLAGKTVVDAGCGGGRFLRFVSDHCEEIVGIDYSIAIERARDLTRGKKNVHLIQADINHHPLKPGRFDIAYSHGVIHHTPNTKKAFDRLPELVKPGGLFYLAVFRKSFEPLQWSDRFWRSLLNKLPIPMLDKVCGGLSYLAYLPQPIFWKRFFWFSMQKTHEIRKCCLYDWYGPTYHHEHTVEEVFDWFKQSGFTDLSYINAWPYCPPQLKYAIPTFWDSFRLGQLLGVRGRKKS